MMNLRKFFIATGLVVWIMSDLKVSAQGILLRGIGAVNESMGGAAVAAPLDATGAIYWNPASISAFKQNEISFGLGLIIPKSSVSSQVSIAGTGQVVASGSSKSDAGSIPAPTMSFLWRKTPSSPFTFAIGLAGIGGAATLYESNPENPILEGHSKSASVSILQLTPTISYQVNEHLSIGFAPIVGLANLSLNPMNLGRPVMSPLYNYGTRYTWGAGFQIGALYDFKNHFKAGLSFKSPIWTKDLDFRGSTSSEGVVSPASAYFAMNLPMMLSVGTSYDGFDKTLIALDFRYMDYGNTKGFNGTLEVENGVPVVRGMGCQSVYVIALGVQREINEKIKLRGGYTFNTLPISAENQMFAVAAPLILKHSVTMGLTYTIPGDIDFSCAGAYVLDASETGAFPTGNAALAGSVTNSSYAFSAVFGMAKRF